MSRAKELKAEKYWDVGCDICAKHLSTDFGYGMFPTANDAKYFAKDAGFTVEKGYNLCPYCYNNYIRGFIKLPPEGDTV